MRVRVLRSHILAAGLLAEVGEEHQLEDHVAVQRIALGYVERIHEAPPLPAAASPAPDIAGAPTAATEAPPDATGEPHATTEAEPGDPAATTTTDESPAATGPKPRSPRR